jgi:hypothetical protein
MVDELKVGYQYYVLLSSGNLVMFQVHDSTDEAYLGMFLDGLIVGKIFKRAISATIRWDECPLEEAERAFGLARTPRETPKTTKRTSASAKLT